MAHRVDRLTREAYARAGAHVTESGRVVIINRKPLHPEAPPPGLSKLPEPRRERNTAYHHALAPIPRVVERYASIPEKQRNLYDVNPLTGRYVRNRAGDVLDDLRSQRLADPHTTPTLKKRTLTRVEYMTAQSVADTSERPALTAAAANGRLQIEG